MYNYLAILEKKEISKEDLIKYFKNNNIKVEQIYYSIGIIKLSSLETLHINDLKHITGLEMDNKKFDTA